MQPEVLSRVRTLDGPAAQGRPVRSRADSAALAVLHRAARVLIEDLPGLTDRLVNYLREREPAYRAALDADADDVWQEAHRALRYNVGSLMRPRQFRETARRCTWDIGVHRAQQGVPLDAVQHAFRRGGALVWQGLIEETERRAFDDVRLLVHCAADVWNFVDEHCALVADAYRETERQLAWRRDNARRLMTEALLAGATRVADLPDVARALELPEDGRYAVAVLTGRGAGPAGDPGHAPGPGVRLPERPAGLRALWHADADADRAIAALGDAAPGDLARALPVPPGARLGVSTVVRGLAALGDARKLAETALRCATDTTPVVVLGDHLPAALTVSSPALGAALTDSVLGPLLALDPGDRDVLLQTLTVWLECDGSAPKAGARLYCHRNTVLNRLRRCEQLTGHSLSRPADLVQLSLALTAHRLLPG
ncbi:MULTISPECIES: PucR family transcriptional regulator [Streptomyces]|uniref:PucR family transcriptional regulator n=1 Tax=Streptomyces TaxID=1883 RepID=UPI0022492660|nr:helix-turn-helix domain-containing protein [Streptomyces sp. JHD 1]MCX2969232.1 helix-turn-helix domain-containing protein [Streptomyces sp. JHD 1]